MSLRLVTSAAASAIDVDDAKAHLRIDGITEDALIESMVVSATETAEQITGRAIMPQTWELALDEFPSVIELTRLPVASVTSIKYTDSAGNEQTLASNLYRVRVGDDYGNTLIVPAYNTEWPATLDDVDAVRVRFVAGYASESAVPEPIKAWIKLVVSSMYENRESETTKPTVSLKFVDGLLDRYRVYQ